MAGRWGETARGSYQAWVKGGEGVRLRRLAAPVVAAQPVVTSSRRWEQRGVVRTVVTMWLLRLAFVLGVSPERLHRAYYGQ